MPLSPPTPQLSEVTETSRRCRGANNLKLRITIVSIFGYGCTSLQAQGLTTSKYSLFRNQSQFEHKVASSEEHHVFLDEKQKLQKAKLW